MEYFVLNVQSIHRRMWYKTVITGLSTLGEKINEGLSPRTDGRTIP